MSLGILNGPMFMPPERRPLGASQLPGTCWDVRGFKDCHAQQWTRARDDCQKTGAQDFAGNQSKCIEVIADAYAYNECVPKYCPQEQRSQPVQVGPVYQAGDPCNSANTIRFVQTVVDTPADGQWGTASDQAYQQFVAETGQDWYDIATDCTGTGPYPRVQQPLPPVVKPTETAPPEVEPPVVPIKTTGVSKGAVLAGVGALSVLGIGGYYIGKKKGWFR